MCIVFYTQSQPGYKLILAANRDEFLDRPASEAEWHNFDDTSHHNSWVLCGRDLGSPDRGTWLGITSDLRVGILTNIRYPIREPPPNAPSRGHLLKEFLAAPPDQAPSVTDFLAKIDPSRYVGFNLLLFNLRRQDGTWNTPEAGYLSNRSSPPILHPDDCGCRGMSNSPLTQPYPKVQSGEERMAESLTEWAHKDEDEDQLVERMMDLLSPAPPVHSAVDMTYATQIAPLRIGDMGLGPASGAGDDSARWYATRVATVILVRDDGKITFVERDRTKLKDGEVVHSNTERREVFSV
ncbi:hypothetical protein CspHIS471_0304000 [Cutaneotrichosporon sp. HIS471]|nr:hypothetical protein CspHIS471_0304000 [Cutaneotrichosporon sp. HIS471]